MNREHFRGKKVLITGGAGFVGSNLARELIQTADKVAVVDNLEPDCGGNQFNLEGIRESLDFYSFDLRHKNKVFELIEGFDYIFNLAGKISHKDSMIDPHTDMEVNSRIHLNLLQACLEKNRDAVIVYTSTRQIYGEPEYAPVDEKHPIRPIDINGIHKWAGESYHSIFAKAYGLKTCSLRLTNTYGPRQGIQSPKTGFVGWFLNRALLGETIELFGGGTQTRDFTYIDDVIDAILRVATQESCFGRAFNLSGEKADLKTIAEKLIQLSGKGQIREVPRPESDKKIGLKDYFASSALLKQETGWELETSIDCGLDQTVSYYKDCFDRYLSENEKHK